MNKEYCYKLEKLVNNLNSDSNKFCDNYHKMKYKEYSDGCAGVYSKYKDLFIEMADENMTTIADLDNYINWILYDK